MSTGKKIALVVVALVLLVVFLSYQKEEKKKQEEVQKKQDEEAKKKADYEASCTVISDVEFYNKKKMFRDIKWQNLVNNNWVDPYVSNAADSFYYKYRDRAQAAGKSSRKDIIDWALWAKGYEMVLGAGFCKAYAGN